jgi:hypothetical protein
MKHNITTFKLLQVKHWVVFLLVYAADSKRLINGMRAFLGA